MKWLIVTLFLITPLSAQHMDLPIDPDAVLGHEVNYFGDANSNPSTDKPNSRARPTSEPAPPQQPDPPQFFGEDIPVTSTNLIYVIDLSGSMNIGDRLLIAKNELISSISQLDSLFLFNVYGYSWNGGLRLVRCFDASVVASPVNKGLAVLWIGGLVGGGGTPTGPAVVVAVGDSGAGIVLLLSDGSPNSPFFGTTPQRCNLHRELLRTGCQATIHTFGIDASGDFRNFLQHVAQDHGGSYVSVH